ncbi:MAG: hypothetical protein Q9201_002275 [Fulgogasparrea decipioides]
MNGLGVHDGMRANGSVHNRVLRVLLRSNLTLLQPLLQDAVRMSFTKEMASGAAMKHGEAVPRVRDDLATAHQLGWIKLQTFAMAKNIVVQVNSTAFFGVGLSRDPLFLEAALRYPQDVFVASEALRFVPTFMASYVLYLSTILHRIKLKPGRKVASLITRQGEAAETLVRYLTPVVNARLHTREQSKSLGQHKPLDCIQWIVDTMPRKQPWSAEKIVQVVLGLWFASVHQLAMSVVYGLYDLCKYPDYVAALRDELTVQEGRVENLVLMDSFLKESARMCPSDSSTSPRPSQSLK